MGRITRAIANVRDTIPDTIGLINVIVVSVLGIFGIKVDTGNPYLDAAVAIILVAILLLVLVVWYPKTKGRGRPKTPE